MCASGHVPPPPPRDRMGHHGGTDSASDLPSSPFPASSRRLHETRASQKVSSWFCCRREFGIGQALLSHQAQSGEQNGQQRQHEPLPWSLLWVQEKPDGPIKVRQRVPWLRPPRHQAFCANWEKRCIVHRKLSGISMPALHPSRISILFFKV